jgi:hypothetical protein
MMSGAFLSMQNPSTFINLIILIFLLFFFLKDKNKNTVYYFLAGSFSVIIFLFLFFLKTKIPIENFLQQYFLFPLTMGEYRVSGNEMAHISLSERFTFRNVIGHFKFINFFLIVLVFFTARDFLKKNISLENLITNLSLFLIGISLIFNQLITSNQTYIFSFIPFIAAFLHLYLSKRNQKNKNFKYLIVVIMFFCVIKYHFVYNEQRKFMDLQNIDLKKAVNANILDSKFKGLKWITSRYPNNPLKEINFLKEAIKIIDNDSRAKLVMTDYQFLSFITGKNLNIPNRWYTHDNNSYPLDNHKYFEFYKKHINKIIKTKNIAVVYTVGDPNFNNFKIYLNKICFNSSEINELTTIHTFKNCN